MSQTEQNTTQTFPFERLMQLPEVVHLEQRQRRFIRKDTEIDIQVLKPQQAMSFDMMMKFILDPQNAMRYFLLEGFAGTGKTFTMSLFTEWLLNQKLKGRAVRVAMTAPTNKAVKVQYDMAEYKDSGLNYITCHSLLGLREKIDSNGKQTFVQLSRDHSKIGEYDVVIIDEASMLPDELFMLIHEEVIGRGLKVLFMGDPCQIPPVGATDSIPFTEEGRDQYNIGVATLTEIVRQKDGNAIVELSMQLRENLHREKARRMDDHTYNEDTLEGVYFIGQEMKAEFYAMLDQYFSSENFKAEANFCKVIAWTNKIVDLFNSHIRKLIYKAEPHIAKIMIGEKLVANGPIIDVHAMDTNKIIFNNNDEFVVEDVDAIETDTFRGVDLKYYKISVKQRLGGLFGADFVVKKILVLHEDSEEEYLKILNALVELAKKAPKGFESSQKWADFYRFQENFADVKYNYATTAHKSQGSTYDNAFVFESDIDKNRNIVERNRIKYTAFTRPRHKLFVLN